MPLDMPPEPPAALVEIQQMATVSVGEESDAASNLRLKVLREAAADLAFRRAVATRYAEHMGALQEPETARLADKTFDYRIVTSPDGRMLFPVITQTDHSISRRNTDLLSESQVTYRIVEPAKMVVTQPSWRNYLIKAYSYEERVNPAVLPRTSEEQMAWKLAAAHSWDRGLKHGDQLFELNMNRLERDFRGRILFKTLWEQGLVEMPKRAEANYGIVVNGNTLSIGQREFTIVQHGKFNQVDQWRPITASPALP